MLLSSSPKTLPNQAKLWKVQKAIVMNCRMEMIFRHNFLWKHSSWHCRPCMLKQWLFLLLPENNPILHSNLFQKSCESYCRTSTSLWPTLAPYSIQASKWTLYLANLLQILECSPWWSTGTHGGNCILL